MPLYEYQCDACNHRFERIQKFSDPPVDACPVCGAAVRKLISSPAIQFKGSGWYITDYAKKSPADGNKPAPSPGSSSSTDAAASPGSSSTSPSTSTGTSSSSSGPSGTSGSSGSDS